MFFFAISTNNICCPSVHLSIENFVLFFATFFSFIWEVLWKTIRNHHQRSNTVKYLVFRFLCNSKIKTKRNDRRQTSESGKMEIILLIISFELRVKASRWVKLSLVKPNFLFNATDLFFFAGFFLSSWCWCFFFFFTFYFLWYQSIIMNICFGTKWKRPF